MGCFRVVLKWGGFVILLISVCLGFLYAYLGVSVPVAVFQIMAQVRMSMGNSAAIGRSTIETWTAVDMARSMTKKMLAMPEISQLRADVDSAVGFMWQRAPLGTLSSCPRTVSGISKDVNIPGRPHALRAIQIDWDASSYSLETTPVILYFHGGGYVSSTPEVYVPFLARLSRRTGARAFSVDYRLAPEQRLPGILDDALAAYKYLVDDLRVPTRLIAIGGDSAGGGIVIGLLQRIIAEGLAVPAAAFPLSPWLDLSFEASESSFKENGEKDFVCPRTTLEWMRNHALPDGWTDFKDPRVSFLYGSFEKFPPLFVAASKTENLKGDAIELVKRVNAAGYGPADLFMPDLDLLHVWITSCYPEGVEDTGVLAHWINRQLLGRR